MMPKPMVPAEGGSAAALEFAVASFAYEVERFAIDSELGQAYGWQAAFEDLAAGSATTQSSAWKFGPSIFPAG